MSCSGSRDITIDDRFKTCGGLVAVDAPSGGCVAVDGPDGGSVHIVPILQYVPKAKEPEYTCSVNHVVHTQRFKLVWPVENHMTLIKNW